MRNHSKKWTTPLIYRMASCIEPPPKRDIEEAYRSIQNRLRRYSATSIAELALHLMWNQPESKRDQVATLPWLTLLLVKWAVQDRGVHLRVGTRIPLAEMDDLRQRLWELQGVNEREDHKPNVWLMLRSILYGQYEFQRGPSWGFLRWPALFDRLDSGSVCRRHFREVMGLEPAEYLDMAYGLYAAVLDGNMPLNADWLAPFRAVYGAKVDRMYDLLVRDLASLRIELERDEAHRIRGKQEIFEFPYLRRFPFLRLRDGRLHCWHPIVFARGVEEAVHLRLSQIGKDYVDEFSRVYERYVTELAMQCGMRALDEQEYKSRIGGHASAVEVILEGHECNIFVEAKMALFADDVLLQDSEIAIHQKTKRLRDAIKQGWKVGALIRSPESGFGSRFQTETDYLIVVTNRELLLSNGDALCRLYAPGAFDYPDDAARARLPLSHVFIVSIEDFENTMGCVEAGEVDLSKLLKEAVVANQRGDTARMFFSDFLGKYTRRWRMSKVLRDARNAAERRVVTALGGTASDLARMRSTQESEDADAQSQN